MHARQSTHASNAHPQFDCFVLRASAASKYLLAEKATSFLPVCPAGMTSISGSTYARQDLWWRALIFAVIITRTIAIQFFCHKFATPDMIVVVVLRIRIIFLSMYSYSHDCKSFCFCCPLFVPRETMRPVALKVCRSLRSSRHTTHGNKRHTNSNILVLIAIITAIATTKVV